MSGLRLTHVSKRGPRVLLLAWALALIYEDLCTFQHNNILFILSTFSILQKDCKGCWNLNAIKSCITTFGHMFMFNTLLANYKEFGGFILCVLLNVEHIRPITKICRIRHWYFPLHCWSQILAEAASHFWLQMHGRRCYSVREPSAATISFKMKSGTTLGKSSRTFSFTCQVFILIFFYCYKDLSYCTAISCMYCV